MRRKIKDSMTAQKEEIVGYSLELPMRWRGRHTWRLIWQDTITRTRWQWWRRSWTNFIL